MPLVNYGEQRDDRTNHYKSVKGEKDAYFCAESSCTLARWRGMVSSFSFAHPINLYIFIRVHINSGKL